MLHKVKAFSTALSRYEVKYKARQAQEAQEPLEISTGIEGLDTLAEAQLAEGQLPGNTPPASNPFGAASSAEDTERPRTNQSGQMRKRRSEPGDDRPRPRPADVLPKLSPDQQHRRRLLEADPEAMNRRISMEDRHCIPQWHPLHVPRSATPDPSPYSERQRIRRLRNRGDHGVDHVTVEQATSGHHRRDACTYSAPAPSLMEDW